MLVFNAIGLSDPGCVRTVNEDAFLIHQAQDELVTGDQTLLAIVADGVGGYTQGDKASHECVRVMQEKVFESSFKNGPGVLKDAMEHAHRHIRALVNQEHDPKPIGTTCTAVWIADSKAYVAHVGDSRAYLIRNKRPIQITEDQTLVQKLLNEGLITKEEAAHHPQKNVILQALGISDPIAIQMFHLTLQERDAILLCTDGLHNLIKDSEIAELAIKSATDIALEELIDLAKKRGGHDNITAIIIKEGELNRKDSDRGPAAFAETREFSGHSTQLSIKQMLLFLLLLGGITVFVWLSFGVLFR